MLILALCVAFMKAIAWYATYRKTKQRACTLHKWPMYCAARTDAFIFACTMSVPPSRHSQKLRWGTWYNRGIKWSRGTSNDQPISQSLDHPPIRVLYLGRRMSASSEQPPPKPQSFLNQTRRNIIQKYSKLKHKDEQAQVYKYLPISTGVLALIVAIVAWWQKMSFLIYLRP